MYSNEDYLIQLLTEAGHLLPDQVNNVRAKLSGDEIIPHLIDTGVLTESTIVEVSAANLGTQVVDLLNAFVDPVFSNVMSLEDCRRFEAVPFADDGSYLSVAIADPLNFEVTDALPFVVGREVNFYAATPTAIHSAWQQIFGDEVGNADAEELVVGGDAHSDGADAPVITKADGLEANQLATPPSLPPEDPEKQPEKRSLAERCEFGLNLLTAFIFGHLKFYYMEFWHAFAFALLFRLCAGRILTEFERGR